MMIMPIVLGTCSGYWVNDAIDSSTANQMKILCSAILGFSLSLLYDFITMVVTLRLSDRYSLGEEMTRGCLSIFFAGTLGSVVAGVVANYQLLN
jgi:hypothetical protein